MLSWRSDKELHFIKKIIFKLWRNLDIILFLIFLGIGFIWTIIAILFFMGFIE
jgi:hypothetical protein